MVTVDDVEDYEVAQVPNGRVELAATVNYNLFQNVVDAVFGERRVQFGMGKRQSPDYCLQQIAICSMYYHPLCVFFEIGRLLTVLGNQYETQ